MSEEFQPGRELHGFTVTARDHLPELNATLIQLRHERTGARMAHLETADDNNLFGVGFRTTPRNSTGVAHILEHTVLSGSEHYPVRDPFFSMIKRSLNTFMNALTSSDWTLYPFSSQNRKDFYNLMDIYLDASFFPLLRERDFRQEGHRLEFSDPEDPTSPLTFKGVVYNEMKGAMADPSSLLGRRMAKALYSTTTYGYNSGGEPADILDLSWEELRAFHADYYHPSNAWFFTYGNFPLEDHLARVEEKALSRFEGPRDVDSAVPPEVRFDQPRQVTETFPLDPGEPLAGRSMVQMGWLACPVADSLERLGLNIVSLLLLGNPAAPLYKALLDSKLGQNLAPGTGYHDDNRDTYFAAGLQGTDPEKTDKIEEVILSTLEKCVLDGFSAERVESAIHQLEFSHREVIGDQYPYSLILLMRVMGSWLHDDDPLTPLQIESLIAQLRQKLEEGPWLEDLIRRHFLENPHRVTLTLRPDTEQKEREEQATAARLETITRELTEEDRERIVRQARELKEAQEKTEDLSVLPSLEREDIPARERTVPFSRDDREDTPVYWLDQPTNGIGYFVANLASDDFPEELRPYATLFCSALTHVGAAGHSYEEMAERIAATTGGIRANVSLLDDPADLGRFRTTVEVKGKALIRHQGSLYGILEEIFGAPDFTDLDRLATVIGQIRVSMENSIPGSGHSYAAKVAASRLTPAARQREEWGGMSAIRLVRRIATGGQDEIARAAEHFRAIAEHLLSRSRLRCGITAEERNFSAIRSPLESFLGTIPARQTPGEGADSTFTPHPDRTGWAYSVPVSYVARSFRTVPYTHPDAAPLMVLARLLRAGFLHREIREKGGAYGGMANFDAESGIFSMLSYRDPNITRTLKVYRQAADWGAQGRFNDTDLKEATLSVFSALDRPLSPGSRGHREFANQLQGMTPEMRQELRERILATRREDLQQAAERHLCGNWEQSAVAVVSSEEALRKANTELGPEEALEIEKI